jgi:putative transposase
MRRTFKYNIRANKQTIENLERILELCRVLYNLGLEQRILMWKQWRKQISWYDQNRQLGDLKKEFLEFKDVPSQAAYDVMHRLDLAYRAFFRRLREKSGAAGFPRFRGKNRVSSLTLSNQEGWNIQGGYLIIGKIGRFRLKQHRPINGLVKTLTIKKSPTGKWYACFSCDYVPLKLLPSTNKSIGVDVGCESFLTNSDGGKIGNPRFLKKSHNKLSKMQHLMSRKHRNSNNRRKTRLLSAGVYEKISNQRRDFHFKAANLLVKENDAICIEKMSSWTSSRPLNKSMRDVAWFDFFNKLRFKAEEAGREVIEVPAAGTSQLCSRCGANVPKNLSVRVHDCPNCGLIIDRDWNSAINILKLGQGLPKVTPAERLEIALEKQEAYVQVVHQ